MDVIGYCNGVILHIHGKTLNFPRSFWLRQRNSGGFVGKVGDLSRQIICLRKQTDKLQCSVGNQM